MTDPYLWAVVARSILFCLLNAAWTMLVGVAIAMLMTQLSGTIRLILQLGLFLAWAMPILASLTVWQWLFDTQYGVINWLLSNVLGLDQLDGRSWLINPLSFYFVATVVIVWMSVPFVVFSVRRPHPGSHRHPEAAQIDGATGWQRFRAITVPMIKPVLMIVGLLQIIWDLRVFTQIFVLQDVGGWPATPTSSGPTSTGWDRRGSSGWRPRRPGSSWR